MSTLYITEYGSPGRFLATGVVPVGLELMLADQTPVTISGSHAESATLNASTQLVRLHTDTICSVKFAVTPVATTSNRRMAANQTEYFAVPQNSGFKVSVIANT